jgi:hypothetical protein
LNARAPVMTMTPANREELFGAIVHQLDSQE